jgi:hypothetical protein
VFYNWLDMIEFQHGIPMYRDFEKWGRQASHFFI